MKCYELLETRLNNLSALRSVQQYRFYDIVVRWSFFRMLLIDKCHTCLRIAFIALLSWLFKPFCVRSSLIFKIITRFLILSKHSSASLAILSGVSNVMLIHTNFVFSVLISSPTRLADFHTLSVLSRINA